MFYDARSYKGQIRYIFTAIGFPAGDSGPYTCTQKAKNSNKHKEKQHRLQNTQNRRQNVRNNKTKIERIITRCVRVNFVYILF